MDATEKRHISQKAKDLIINGWIWFIYTPERCEYLAKRVKHYCGKDIKVSPEFGTLNGKPVARISL